MITILVIVALIATLVAILCSWKEMDMQRPYDQQRLRWIPDDPFARWKRQ